MTIFLRGLLFGGIIISSGSVAVGSYLIGSRNLDTVQKETNIEQQQLDNQNSPGSPQDEDSKNLNSEVNSAFRKNHSSETSITSPKETNPSGTNSENKMTSSGNSKTAQLDSQEEVQLWKQVNL